LAQVHRLFIAFVHRQPMREVEKVAAIADRGLEGCIHGRPGGRRQVLLMDRETLEELEVSPGAIRENVTTQGLNLKTLAEGQRLRVGAALLEVTVPCHPCHLMDEIRPGLKETLRGRRGWLCRVVETGLVKQGDAIEVLDYSQVAN
jgi:MOSC domain-containing protein YiiM